MRSRTQGVSGARLRILIALAAVFIAPAVTSSASAATVPSAPFTYCPAVGADTSCALVIYVTDSGVGVTGNPTQGPFDGVEDTLIGVVNQSSHSVSSLPLLAKTTAFGFDGDGLCNIGGAPLGCPFGPTGYEGPGTSFSAISADLHGGTVNFAGGLAPGASTYFSLEESLSTVPPYDIGPAASLRYVALGDSYSAGEGAGAGRYFQWQETRYRCTRTLHGIASRPVDSPRPLPNYTCTSYTVGHDIGCHRAPTAWSFGLALKSADIIDSIENAACTGATIDRNLLYKRKDNEQPQVERLQQLNAAKAVDLVTFTIGGNDVGFADIGQACFVGNGPAYNCRGAQKGVQKKLDKLDLAAPIRKLHEAAPGAVIAYVSYPQVVPDNDAAVTKCRWLDGPERASLRSVVGEINLAEYNAVLKAKSEGINAVFVDISDALSGHEICTDNSHVVPIRITGNHSEQAHPDAIDRSASGGTSGQQDLQNAVYARLISLGVITG
jgi:hypothetical protein